MNQWHILDAWASSHWAFSSRDMPRSRFTAACKAKMPAPPAALRLSTHRTVRCGNRSSSSSLTAWAFCQVEDRPEEKPQYSTSLPASNSGANSFSKRNGVIWEVDTSARRRRAS